MVNGKFANNQKCLTTQCHNLIITDNLSPCSPLALLLRARIFQFSFHFNYNCVLSTHAVNAIPHWTQYPTFISWWQCLFDIPIRRNASCIWQHIIFLLARHCCCMHVDFNLVLILIKTACGQHTPSMQYPIEHNILPLFHDDSACLTCKFTETLPWIWQHINFPPSSPLSHYVCCPPFA